MSIKDFKINSKIKKYKVSFPSFDDLFDILINIENAFYIIDYNVWKNYKKELSFIKDINSLLIIKSNEKIKNFSSVFKIYEKIFELNSKKNTNIIAIGGGILQDIAGFAASTIYRGINWYFVPTTSLSQIDSCIGGKTSLNYKKYKNLVGTFYPPSEVIINPFFLKTLKKEYYYSGIGEMVKLFIIDGEKKAINMSLYINEIVKERDIKLLSQLIFDSLLIKKKYIEMDEMDKGIRNYLNYGHCFGHALEGATNFKISHGLAVVVGMMVANKISLQRKLIDIEMFNFINEKLFKPLSKEINFSNIKINNETILNFMKKDKKRVGKDLTMVLVKKNYSFEVFNDITPDEITFASNYFLKLNKKNFFK